MKTSMNMIAGNTATPTGTKVKRSSLAVGDLFKGATDNRVYMHTGCRSCPPTERGVTFTVGAHEHFHEIYVKQGKLPNGKDIIGWQSMVVAGTIVPGEDGTAFTTNGDRKVTLVGTAELTLHM